MGRHCLLALEAVRGCVHNVALAPSVRVAAQGVQHGGLQREFIEHSGRSGAVNDITAVT